MLKIDSMEVDCRMSFRYCLLFRNGIFQMQGECCAFAFFAFGADCAALHFHQGFHDGKSEPGTFDMLDCVVFFPLERFENFRHLLFGNTDSRILDLDFEMGGFGIVGCFLEHFENDGPVHRGEFYGIAEQIGEYAFKVAYIADNGVVFNGTEFKFKIPALFA